MSRCFPYPPPGFNGKRAIDEALIQSIKLQKGLEKATTERRKEKKREKKEKRRETKKHKETADLTSTGISCEKYVHKLEKSCTKLNGGDTNKRKLEDAEQLERSDITEEHGRPLSLQNPSYSSDSTQNSNKRRKQATSDVTVDTDSPHNDAIASAGGEVRCKRPIPELPDINIELPALSVKENSMDNADPSTSKTQSLDIDLLHAEQPSNEKSNHRPGGHLGPEWSSRWIKRLKLSSASGSFSIGTKSMNLGKTTSHDKVNKFFGRIIKGGIPNSDLTLAKSAGKELMVLDQKTASVRNGESSSVGNVENGDDITLSHFWIQRWLHNRAATPQKKPEAVVVCDPQSSKVSLEDFRKKQFPSIAAMALMGKARNGFQPCQFQNKGSLIVWNTKSV